MKQLTRDRNGVQLQIGQTVKVVAAPRIDPAHVDIEPQSYNHPHRLIIKYGLFPLVYKCELRAGEFAGDDPYFSVLRVRPDEDRDSLRRWLDRMFVDGYGLKKSLWKFKGFIVNFNASYPNFDTLDKKYDTLTYFPESYDRYEVIDPKTNI